MTLRLLVLCAGVLLLAGAERVFAHHSFSATYDSSAGRLPPTLRIS